jgi:hypothetical protein
LTVKISNRYDFVVPGKAPLTKEYQRAGGSKKKNTKECDMAAGNATKISGWKDGEGNPETKKVPLESLSELTGFPVDFIKKELLLDQESLSMEDLRKSMVNYLENTAEELKI